IPLANPSIRSHLRFLAFDWVGKPSVAPLWFYIHMNRPGTGVAFPVFRRPDRRSRSNETMKRYIAQHKVAAVGVILSLVATFGVARFLASSPSPALNATPSPVAAAAAPDVAPNIRGSATGPTSAPGYNHPDQYIQVKDVKPADNMYPVVPHPDQDREARDKLAALEQKTGKKPNILFFLLDDVGWMDPGFNGGGIAVGNETPTMDKLANEGLLLTSSYSTPSCSPSRATIMTGQNPLHHGILRPPMYGEPGG